MRMGWACPDDHVVCVLCLMQSPRPVLRHEKRLNRWPYRLCLNYPWKNFLYGCPKCDDFVDVQFPSVKAKLFQEWIDLSQTACPYCNRRFDMHADALRHALVCKPLPCPLCQEPKVKVFNLDDNWSLDLHDFDAHLQHECKGVWSCTFPSCEAQVAAADINSHLYAHLQVFFFVCVCVNFIDRTLRCHVSNVEQRTACVRAGAARRITSFVCHV